MKNIVESIIDWVDVIYWAIRYRKILDELDELDFAEYNPHDIAPISAKEATEYLQKAMREYEINHSEICETIDENYGLDGEK